MPLPSTPPISSNDIQAEFGGSAPFVITDYYRGGGLVPNTSANSGVPTSGSISILDFLGASAIDANWVNQTASSFVGAIDPQDSVAELLVLNDGTTGRFTTNGGFVSTGTWLLQGNASDYSVRAVAGGGDTPYGTLNTWLALSTTRTWGLSSSAGLKSGSLTVTLRHNASSTTWVATYQLTANKGQL